MTTEWLVIKTEEGSEQSSVQKFGSAEDVQSHIADLIADGVAAESLVLYNAKAVQFAVAYKPVVNLGDGPASDGAEAGEAGDAPADAEAQPQGSQNGVRLSSMFKTD